MHLGVPATCNTVNPHYDDWLGCQPVHSWRSRDNDGQLGCLHCNPVGCPYGCNRPNSNDDAGPVGAPPSDDQYRHRPRSNVPDCRLRPLPRLSPQYQHHRLSTERSTPNSHQQRPRAPPIATEFPAVHLTTEPRHPQSPHATRPPIGTDRSSPRSARRCRWYLHETGWCYGYRRRDHSSQPLYRQIYKMRQKQQTSN